MWLIPKCWVVRCCNVSSSTNPVTSSVNHVSLTGDNGNIPRYTLHGDSDFWSSKSTCCNLNSWTSHVWYYCRNHQKIWTEYMTEYTPWKQYSNWKLMVGRCIPFSDGLFSEAMLVSGSIAISDCCLMPAWSKRLRDLLQFLSRKVVKVARWWLSFPGNTCHPDINYIIV